MGLYQLCKHKGRARDRCDHVWWGAFQHQRKLHRESLSKWTGEEIRTKAHAEAVFDHMKEGFGPGRWTGEGTLPRIPLC